MGNNLEKLRHGFLKFKDKEIVHAAKLQDNYADMLALFGGKDNLPSSVIRVKRNKLDKASDPHASEQSCVEYSKKHGFLGDESIRSKTLRRMKYISKTGSQNGVLSRFPQDLARKILLFYTKPGDVVVDPFAGHNSRMEACIKAGCLYFGQELLKKFHDSNVKRAEKLDPKGVKFMLSHGDSRELQFPDECGDFGFTCPPYHDIENYDPTDPRQLGNVKYPEFLKGLGRVMREHYRTLKPGAYCVWVVNYFRRNGKLIRFHDDTKQLGLNAGFEIHDEIILDHGRAMRDAFFSSCYKIKILPKRHEVCIVFRKPKPEKPRSRARR